MFNINPNFGEVFTPSKWGQFAAQASNIYQAWLEGATILDPFMGNGSLLLSLIDLAIINRIPREQIPLTNLYGIDWQPAHIEDFQQELIKRNLTFFSNNFFIADTFFFQKNLSIDIIFTNPPWITFNHLSQQQQENLKPLFLRYHLVNTSSIIMGGSHVDLAALALTVALVQWPPRMHKLVSFVPHSLLTSAAHAPWRAFSWPQEQPLKPLWYYNLSNLKVFPISCDYGLLNLSLTEDMPLYFKKNSPHSKWKEHPWPHGQTIENRLTLKKIQRPRQGVNTSGANQYFIFNTYEEKNDGLVKLSNNKQEVLLPQKLIAPLLTSENFKEKTFLARRWIFLPYNIENGTLLPIEEIFTHYHTAYQYLKEIEPQLTNRKGTMLKSYMQRGDFYALLGVNSYTFTPYKVVWQAMGSYQLEPIITTDNVQANQAIHAYIPAYTLREALHIQAYLQSLEVQNYFKGFDVAGSKSFAQPHRIAQLFNFI